MKSLMEQWEKRVHREDVKGQELFSLLGLLRKEKQGYALKYAHETVHTVLLQAHTAYLLEQLSLTEEECVSAQKHNVLLLHKYNKLKDAAQDVLGRIAQCRGCTLKEAAEEYGAPAEETHHARE
ncbi:hypothetical protein NECID01_0133 [Nematocida sp. AWRm77]|nr:hypothetical protein NECID01_0133 [Nematocida sp. AWRm77]